MDLCSQSPCLNGGTCQVDTLNPKQFVCSCPEGTTGEMCEVVISPCAVSPCQNFGTCVEQDNSFVCECQNGFSGAMCEVDINVCNSAPCANGGTCVEGYGLAFSCECPPEFSGALCQTQVIFCTENSCANDGTCNELEGGFDCSCASGFTGENCQLDINECEIMPCQNNGTCVNLPGSYMCACNPGFTGFNCETVINFCANQTCFGNGECVSMPTGFVCECNPGYTGNLCNMDVNECDSSPCENGANCTNGINMYMCVCQPGFTGQNCEINIDDCASSPCMNNGNCIDDIAEFTCECVSGFAGDLCEIQTNFCLNNPCFNGNCSSTDTSFTCTCPPGWTGDLCQYALSVEVKLSSCGLPSARDVLTDDEQVMNNEPFAFTTGTVPMSKMYEIPENFEGLYWSGWIWQDANQATLFSFSDGSISAQLVSDLTNQQLVFYYTENDHQPVSETIDNVPLAANQWHHITTAFFPVTDENDAQIVVAVDTVFTQTEAIRIRESPFDIFIPLEFSLVLGANAPRIQAEGPSFIGLMRGVAIAGIQQRNSFDITSIESCLLSCLSDTGLCGSNGVCFDQFAFDRVCVCNSGYTGLQCNYPHTRFQVNGAGSLSTTTSYPIQAFDFKPQSTNGQLASQIEQNANVMISLNDGSLNYNRDYCDSTQQNVTVGTVTSDFQWHTLTLSGSVQLDSMSSIALPSPMQPVCNSSNIGQVSLGQAFQGCLREVQFENMLLSSTFVSLQGDAMFGCTHDTARFFTLSYVQLPEFISRESQTISLEFNTLSENGTLYFSNRVPSDATGNITNDFVAITLESGRVRFSFNLGEQGADTIVEIAAAYNDGQWHRVEALQNMTMAMLTVDNQFATATSPGSFTLLDTTGSVYVGGAPDSSRPGFNGCVRDLEQNGVAADLQDNIAVQNVRFGTCN